MTHYFVRAKCICSILKYHSVLWHETLGGDGERSRTGVTGGGISRLIKIKSPTPFERMNSRGEPSVLFPKSPLSSALDCEGNTILPRPVVWLFSGPFLPDLQVSSPLTVCPRIFEIQDFRYIKP